MNIAVPTQSIAIEEELLQKQAKTIAKLRHANERLHQENAELLRQLAEVKKRCAELEEKLNTNSSNSSKPPSQDPYRRRKSKRKPSSRKRGAQPGHQAHHRELVPPDKVAEFHDVLPEKCPRCAGTSFENGSVKIVPRQVIELPEITPYILQYNIHSCTCLNCQSTVTADIPKEALKGFGPRLMGFATVATGELGLSKRKVAKLLAYLDIRICVGSIANIHRLASDILARPYEEIRERMVQQTAINMDETSWYRAGKRKWLWLATCKECTLFRIDPFRNREASHRLLGEIFRGTLTTDRYAVYNEHKGPRQNCWSHLDRDFEKISHRSHPDHTLGKRLEEEADEVFRLWRAFKAGLISRHELRCYTEALIQPVIKALLFLGEIGGECTSKSKNTCRNLLNNFDHLWTYLHDDGVEPTNNEAERQLRPAVIWRKISYGSQSDWGEHFVERILSVIETVKKQARDTYSYMATCFGAYSRDGPIPSPFATSLPS